MLSSKPVLKREMLSILIETVLAVMHAVIFLDFWRTFLILRAQIHTGMH